MDNLEYEHAVRPNERLSDIVDAVVEKAKRFDAKVRYTFWKASLFALPKQERNDVMERSLVATLPKVVNDRPKLAEWLVEMARCRDVNPLSTSTRRTMIDVLESAGFGADANEGLKRGALADPDELIESVAANALRALKVNGPFPPVAVERDVRDFASLRADPKVRADVKERDRLMSGLGSGRLSRDELVTWAESFSELAAKTQVRIDYKTVAATLERAGFVSGDEVGRPVGDYRNPGVMARFVLGQVVQAAKAGEPASAQAVARDAERFRVAVAAQKAEERAERAVAFNRQMQATLVGQLPQILGDRARLVEWCWKYAEVAEDDPRAKRDFARIVAMLESVGYEANGSTNLPAGAYEDADNVAKWGVGQAMAAMKSGDAPSFLFMERIATKDYPAAMRNEEAAGVLSR